MNRDASDISEGYIILIILIFIKTSNEHFSTCFSGTAVGKLLTLGGVGMWWIADIILLILGVLRPADDSNWEPMKW